MAFTYTWQALVWSIVGRVLDYTDTNDINEDLYALKERFEIEHSWADNSHTKPGVTAYGRLEMNGDSDPELGLHSHNVIGPVRSETGVFRVSFINPVVDHTTIVASIGWNTTDSTLPTAAFKAYAYIDSTTSAVIYVNDGSDTHTDLDSTFTIDFAVLEG